MRRQYYALRFRASKEGHPGPVEAGDYLRIHEQAGDYLPIHDELYRVDAWLPRDYYPCTPFAPRVVRIRGGHLAHVTRIRDNAQMVMADHIIYRAYDHLEDLPGMDPVRDHRPRRFFAQHMNDYWSAS